MVEGCKELTYVERLRKLGPTTLETRRARADLLEVYKMFNGMEGLNIEDFWERAVGGRTRGHQFKLYKKRFRTNFGKYSFGNRVVIEWISLPEHIVMARDVKEFKRRLDHHL